MLIRVSSDSASSMNETDTPVDETEAWITPAPPISGPIALRGRAREEQQQHPEESHHEFLYPPPKGPRLELVPANRGGARGRRGKPSTTNFGSDLRPGSNRGWASARFSGSATGTASSPGRGRQRPPNLGAFAPPVFGAPPQVTHYDAYASRGAGPYIPDFTNIHSHTRNHSSPAATHSSRLPGLSTPPPSSPFVFTMSTPCTPMPPYPVTPTNEVENIGARPFTPGFRPPRDVSRSPVLGSVSSVYMRRPSPTAPLEARSEPMTRNCSQTTSRTSPMMGGVSLAASPPMPPAYMQPLDGLGIDYAGGVPLPNNGTYLSPRRNPRSIDDGRRVSAPPNQHVDGGSDMYRSRSEPAVSQAATAIMHGLWSDAEFHRPGGVDN